jgi:hypothetical protein
MKLKDKEDTINKSVLLNWLYSADTEVSIEQLGQWISAKTNGAYAIIKKEHGQGFIEHSKLK